jgi:hypothetical protein
MGNLSRYAPCGLRRSPLLINTEVLQVIQLLLIGLGVFFKIV